MPIETEQLIERLLANRPLAMTDAALEELRIHIAAQAAFFNTDPQGAAAAFAADVANRAAPRAGRPATGAVGVIQIRGSITQHKASDLSAALFGGASTEGIAEQLDALLADETVGSILLDIDSGGGQIFGVEALGQKIRAARTKKPIAALANSVMASAAYWLGSQADQVWAAPGAIVGSIGVFSLHQEASEAAKTLGIKTTVIRAGKFKAVANPWEPLPDDAREREQARVDAAYEIMTREIARGRGVPQATVKGAAYGEGDILEAVEAKRAGVVDGIYTYEQALAKVRTLRPAAESDLAAEEEADRLRAEEAAAAAAQTETNARAFRAWQFAGLREDLAGTTAATEV